MRSKYFFASLILVISMLIGTGCNPSAEEIQQAAFEQGLREIAATQTATAGGGRQGQRSYFLEDMSRSLAPSLVGAPLGGSVDQMIAPVSDTELPTAFGANPVTGELAYVKNDLSSGISIEVYNPADGSTSQLVTAESFGKSGTGMMLQYSPDGTHLALTVATLPPDVDPTTLDEQSTPFTEEQLAQIYYEAYVVDAVTGMLTPIRPPNPLAFQMLDWNQSSNRVALNGWSDDNGDGRIHMFPDPTTRNFPDLTQIYEYEVATDTLTQVTTSELNYAPTYVGDELYWLQFDQTRNIGIIKLKPGSVYGTPNILIGMAASPDNTQLAWIELPTNEDHTAVTAPPLLQVASAPFNEPATLMEFSAMVVPDQPKWTPDGLAVLVGSTNLLDIKANELAATYGVAVNREEQGPPRVVQVEVATGAVSMVYVGPITNSSNYGTMMALIEGR